MVCFGLVLKSSVSQGFTANDLSVYLGLFSSNSAPLIRFSLDVVRRTPYSLPAENHPIQSLNGVLCRLGKKVPVCIEGHFYGGVSKLFLDILGALALGYQQGRTGVPQVVKSDSPNPRVFQCWLEYPSLDVPVVKGLALLSREDKIQVPVTRAGSQLFLGLRCTVSPESLTGSRREVHRRATESSDFGAEKPLGCVSVFRCRFSRTKYLL